jgi:hypothetical protein
MQAECGAISTIDGRWRAVKCSSILPTACRGGGGEWQLATGVRGTCPPGYAWEVPHHAKENMQLQSLLKLNAGPPVEAAWLPVAGKLQLTMHALQSCKYVSSVAGAFKQGRVIFILVAQLCCSNQISVLHN